MRGGIGQAKPRTAQLVDVPHQRVEHQARIGRQVASSQDGIPVPLASKRLTRNARHRLAGPRDGRLRAWLLLAWARL